VAILQPDTNSITLILDIAILTELPGAQDCTPTGDLACIFGIHDGGGNMAALLLALVCLGAFCSPGKAGGRKCIMERPNE
jgi:hypothetical protein